MSERSLPAIPANHALACCKAGAGIQSWNDFFTRKVGLLDSGIRQNDDQLIIRPVFT